MLFQQNTGIKPCLEGVLYPLSLSSKCLNSPVDTPKEQANCLFTLQFVLITRLSRPLADEAVYISQVGLNFASLALHPSCPPPGATG